MSRNTPGRVDYPPAVKTGVVLAALLALWGALEYYQYETAYQQQYADPYRIAAQDSRFDGLRAAVPDSAILGYVTDLDAGSVTGESMFNAAQYLLAPRILQKGTRHGLVLGNFTKPADLAALGRQQGLRLVRDFGQGVVLFEEAR